MPDLDNVVGSCLLAWLAVEALFYVVVMVYLVPRMNQIEPPAKFPIEGEKLMHKIMETVDWLMTQDDTDVTFESFVSGWFIGAKCSELKRGNMVELLAWTMFAKEWSTTSKEERESIDRMVKIVEGRLGRTLELGFNPDVSSMHHTVDPVVPFSHRPLALYVALSFCRFFVRGGLRLWGFNRALAPCGKFFYWFRAAPSCPSSSARQGPIVFFHGVGTGLPLYVLAIWKMCRNRTSVIVESPSIAMSLSLLRGHRPPSSSELVESVECIMQSHGLKKAAFFGHSFGSIPVAWMARLKPHLVSQIQLLDPVCMLLFLPKVARSFLHPDKSPMPLMSRIMLPLVTREMGISHTLHRHFWWYANVMWPEDIKCPIVVGLGGKDSIVPSKPLRRYLLSHNSFATTPSDPSSGNSTSKDTYDTCNIASHGRAPSFGGALTFDGKGDRHAPVAATMAKAGWGSGADDIEKIGVPAAKKVELVYWAEAAHGHVLGNPKALDEFVRVATRQEDALFAY